MMAGDTFESMSPGDPAAMDSTATPAQVLEFMDVLAYIYLEHGLPDKAAVLLSARDLLAPDDARVLLTWSLALVRSGKPERGLQTLERMAMLGAMSAEFHLVRAQALQALDRQAEAASAMRAYVALAPHTTPQTPAGPEPLA